MGPHKIIQGEKRVEGKSQRNLNIEGHVQGKGVYRNQQKTVIREMSRNRIITIQKPTERKAFQEEKRNTGKC